jgi:hypothetical protein
VLSQIQEGKKGTKHLLISYNKKETMSTLKEIGNKLFKEDLSSNKIDLGSLQDLDVLFNKANNDDEAIGQALISSLGKAEASYKQNLQALQNAKNSSKELISKAKDLGIDLPPATLNKIETIDGMIKETQGYLSKINQMYSMY